MPASGTLIAQPLHQSHADLPGLIQLVSAIFEGVASSGMRFDAIRSPGWSPSIRTRHGVSTAFDREARTAIRKLAESCGLSRRGDRATFTPRPPSPRPL